MTLHNPSSIKLPPLKIQKMDKLKEMEQNVYIANFIRSKLLLDSDFNKLYIKILEKSEKILDLIGQKEKEIIDLELFLNSKFSAKWFFNYINSKKVIENLDKDEPQKRLEKDFENLDKDEAKKKDTKRNTFI